MSAFGIALPVPTTTCSERCGSQCAVSRCQLSFSEAGQIDDRRVGVVLLERGERLDGLAQPLLVGDEQPPRLQRVAHAGALERPQLAAEARPRRPARRRRRRASGGRRRSRRRARSAAARAPRCAFVADVDRVQADEVLERLQQVRVDRERAAVRLGRRQLDERADRVRVPVDLELEARLAVALDQHQRRRRGLEPDLQPRGAAQRARIQPRARQSSSVSATSSVNGSQRRSPRCSASASSSSGSSPAIPSSTNQPVPAAPRGGHAPDPALDRARQPLLDVRRDLELREALDHALDVGGGGVRARRPPLLGLPVEAPARDRAHGVDDVGAVREREDDGLVARGVASQLDVGAPDRLRAPSNGS